MTANMGVVYALFACVVLLVIDASLGQLWNDLRIRYDRNAANAFYRIGRTRSQVITENKFQFDSYQKDCVWDVYWSGSRLKFYGYKAFNPQDEVLAVLYDVQGTIAGIMTWFRQNLVGQSNFHFNNVWSYFLGYLNGSNYFISVAYFVDPGIICKGGRSPSDLASQGTGTGLWIQKSFDITAPNSVLVVPMNRPGAISEGWSKNNCFPGIGYHNFYRVDTYNATKCLEIEGFFLTFNKQEQLTGFGIRIEGQFPSQYVEHPSNLALSFLYGDPFPQCLLHQNALYKSTLMHVFFTSPPYKY